MEEKTVMKNVPQKIYLQATPDDEDVEDFNELAGVTWCKEKIFNTDIEYRLPSHFATTKTLDELALEFAEMIQTKEGTASRLNAIEWFKAGYNKRVEESAPQREDGFLKGEVGSSVSTEDVQRGYSKSDIENVCFAIRKRIVEANGTDKYLLTSGNEFIHAVWNEIAELPVRQQVVSTEDIIEMIEEERTLQSTKSIWHEHAGAKYATEILDKIISRITAKEKGK